MSKKKRKQGGKSRTSPFSKPQNYWILGTRFIDEEPVILGQYSPRDTPILCTRDHAETVASAWASKPDPDNNDKPMFSEVQVITARTDGKGNWLSPLWASRADILNITRPGHFQVFGRESQKSKFSRLQEYVLGDVGREWVEEAS